MSSIWDKPISHGEILKKIYKHLDLGVLDREHPFHTPVFASVCDGAPHARVVALSPFTRTPHRRRFPRLGATKTWLWLFITRRKNCKSASKARLKFSRAAICTKSSGRRRGFSRAAHTPRLRRANRVRDRRMVCPKN